MKNTTIVIILIVVAVFGIGAYVLSQRSSSDSASMVKKEEVVKDDAVMEKKEDEKMMADTKSASQYVEYSKAAFDQAAGKRRVLYFYASWCPTCRPTDANLKANEGQIPDDVVVLRVNYNDPETDQEEKDLAREYGITYQHTFVQVDATGKSVTNWNGGQLEELLANIT